MDGLPDAFGLLVDLTTATHRSAARAVHQAFGATGYRAESAGEVENAVAATGALFRPDPLLG